MARRNIPDLPVQPDLGEHNIFDFIERERTILRQRRMMQVETDEIVVNDLLYDIRHNGINVKCISSFNRFNTRFIIDSHHNLYHNYDSFNRIFIWTPLHPYIDNDDIELTLRLDFTARESAWYRVYLESIITEQPTYRHLEWTVVKIFEKRGFA